MHQTGVLYYIEQKKEKFTCNKLSSQITRLYGTQFLIIKYIQIKIQYNIKACVLYILIILNSLIS
jgi:hypothetical protein